jgi:uncharacterized protein with beta-barrel porin domain
MIVATVAGYGRRAYAACVNTVGSTYVCSGANVTTQNINGANANNASVSTLPGFSVNTGAGNAITITGDGALSYTDTNASSLLSTGGSAALVVNSGGDFSGTPGSVTINTNGVISGRNGGIYAQNLGTGALTISANGNVTGTNNGAVGISAINYGTNITVTTAVSTTVSVGSFGYGISATNYGTGALTITANGNVTSGTAGSGITATNFGTGTNLSVTTGAGTTVSAGKYGIIASNQGTGALTITANGNVSGGSNEGIHARGYGTALSVTTAAGTTVSGGNHGISAYHYGTGALTITANGNVSGGYSGIFASTSGASLSVTTAAGTTVSGGNHGIYARNYGTGTLTITANGNVTGTIGDGIFARSPGGPIAISVAATGTVTSANGFAIETVGAPATVTVAGTVAGSMQIAGPGSTLTFQSGAIYKVFVAPATASLANVGGTATLGGAAVTASFANGSYISKRYTILTAGSISGSFGTLTNLNLPANSHDSLSYDANHAYLNLDLNFTTPASGTLSGNQNNVANALINFFNTTGGIPMAFASLNAAGLTQVSGEGGNGSTQTTAYNATNQFLGTILDPSIDGRGSDGGDGGGASGYADAGGEALAYAGSRKRSASERDAYAAVTPRDRRFDTLAGRWSVWAAGYGGSSTVDGNAAAGTHTTSSSIYGTAVGADYRIGRDTLIGIAMGGAGTSFNTAQGLGGGRADLFQLGVYGRHNFGAAYIAGALAYGWQDVTIDRTVTVAGADHLRSNFNANTFAARAEAGYSFVTALMGVTPYGALQATTVHLPSYAEAAVSGSNQFALAFASQNSTNVRSELGLRGDKSFAVRDGLLTFRGRAAWAHDSNTDRVVSPTFQALPGASFTVNGAKPSADGALVTAGAEMKWRNGWSVAGTFEGEFSRTTAGYAGKGSVRYVW